MKAPQLQTDNPAVTLVAPNVERDAPLGVQWLSGAPGRHTLALMGVSDQDNHETSLGTEQKRVQGFIENQQQLNWMIQFADQVVGAIWVDMQATNELPAPAVHLMIGDPAARGHGVGKAATTAVIDYLHEQGEATIYSRTLTSNTVASHLFEIEGFYIFGEVYSDSDGLEWQNLINVQA